MAVRDWFRSSALEIWTSLKMIRGFSSLQSNFTGWTKIRWARKDTPGLRPHSLDAASGRETGAGSPSIQIGQWYLGMAELICQQMPSTLSFHHIMNQKVSLLIYDVREDYGRHGYWMPQQKKVVVAHSPRPGSWWVALNLCCTASEVWPQAIDSSSLLNSCICKIGHLGIYLTRVLGEVPWDNMSNRVVTLPGTVSDCSLLINESHWNGGDLHISFWPQQAGIT